MTTRPSHRAPLRRRPYVLNAAEATASRQTGTPDDSHSLQGLSNQAHPRKSGANGAGRPPFLRTLLRDGGQPGHRSVPGRGYPGGPGRGHGLHPRLPPGSGSSRPARRAPQLPLAGAAALQRPQGNHRVHRGELTPLVALAGPPGLGRQSSSTVLFTPDRHSGESRNPEYLKPAE